jgi:hypothetical protein
VSTVLWKERGVGLTCDTELLSSGFHGHRWRMGWFAGDKWLTSGMFALGWCSRLQILEFYRDVRSGFINWSLSSLQRSDVSNE